ncbi:hypothetical protein QTJ16_003365 [Diplocarpon rosae]|uniref:C2H2-type domain-containing protein n=1 Tax=Diplocarpon rosae TaxID=946125 RepID=A0AAD9T2J4_9HELO|nr:hypothetical protein QTJ16_003365 [Diplocarpon rosae]PBP25948.1 dhhc zinc finger membrane protein [Diplocarpon rosae]
MQSQVKLTVMASADKIKPWAAWASEEQGRGRGRGLTYPQNQDHGQDEEPPPTAIAYIYCRTCKREYCDETSFRAHKIKSPRHIVCDVCFIEFHDDEAKKAHRHAYHSAEQDLNCPHCTCHFTRLGSLIGHLELNECRGLPSAAFDEARKVTTEHQDAMRAANRFQDVSRSGNAIDEPLPPLRRYDSGASSGLQAQFGQYPHLGQRAPFVSQPRLGGTGSCYSSGSNYANRLEAQGGGYASGDSNSPLGADTAGSEKSPRPTFQSSANLLTTTDEAIFEDEDLISFTTNAVLSTPWGRSATKLLEVPKFTSSSLYALSNKPCNAALVKPVAVPVSVTRYGNVNSATHAFVSVQPPARTSPGNAWSGSSTAAGLFPDAPSAVAPPIQLLQSMTSKPVFKNKNHIEVDPNQPGFRVSAFWVAPLNKYKCPLCPKSNPNRNAFIAHLKSPAHRQEQLQCRRCLRYYATATALTQHYESQGVRCTARETDSFDSVVLGVTANTALTAGRNADDTIKYAINPDVALPAGASILAAHRSQQQAADIQFNKYWDTRTPKW